MKAKGNSPMSFESASPMVSLDSSDAPAATEKRIEMSMERINLKSSLTKLQDAWNSDPKKPQSSKARQ